MTTSDEIVAAYSSSLDSLRDHLPATDAGQFALPQLAAELDGSYDPHEDDWPLISLPEALFGSFRQKMSSIASMLNGADPRTRSIAADEIVSHSFADSNYSELHSPPDLNQLLVRLASDGHDHAASDIWYDPCCGTGAVASALQRVAGASAGHLIGQDISFHAITAAEARSILTLATPELRLGDTTVHDAYADQECDFAVSFPPMGVRISAEASGDTHSPELNPSADLKHLAPLMVAIAIQKLRTSTGGSAAFLVAPGDFNAPTSSRFMRWLVESGTLRAIVQLPGNLLNNTRLSTAVIVLSTSDDFPLRHGVRIVDASALFADQRRSASSRSRRLTTAHVDEILATTRSTKNSDYARTVELPELGTTRVKFTWPSGSAEDESSGRREFNLDVKLPAGTDPASIVSGRYRTPVTEVGADTFYRIAPSDHVGPHIRRLQVFRQRNRQDLACLAEVADGIATRPYGDEDEDPPPNRVFVSKGGRFSRTTTLAGSKTPVTVIDLSSEHCDPDYVIQFMNSEVGQLLLGEGAQGSMAPTVTKRGLLLSPIPLPDVERQRSAVAEQTAIDNLRDELDALSSSLKSDHQLLESTRLIFEELVSEPGLEPWLKTLPYPMSSAIWAHRSMATFAAKEDQLLKCFESVAEFLATVHPRRVGQRHRNLRRTGPAASCAGSSARKPGYAGLPSG